MKHLYMLCRHVTYCAISCVHLRWASIPFYFDLHKPKSWSFSIPKRNKVNECEQNSVVKIKWRVAPEKEDFPWKFSEMFASRIKCSCANWNRFWLRWWLNYKRQIASPHAVATPTNKHVSLYVSNIFAYFLLNISSKTCIFVSKHFSPHSHSVFEGFIFHLDIKRHVLRIGFEKIGLININKYTM